MSLTNLASTITRLSGGTTLTVTRGASGTYTAGRLTPGETTTLTIAANVQPASGRDLLRLPEGLRTRETIAIWTAAELRTADEDAGTPADRVAYGGATYQVENVEGWGVLGGYRKAIAAKVES